MAEVDGTEALIEGFGELSGRFQRASSAICSNVNAEFMRTAMAGTAKKTRQTRGLAANTRVNRGLRGPDGFLATWGPVRC